MSELLEEMAPDADAEWGERLDELQENVEGHIEEERVKKAVEEITGRCLFMKVLGSYPAHS